MIYMYSTKQSPHINLQFLKPDKRRFSNVLNNRIYLLYFKINPFFFFRQVYNMVIKYLDYLMTRSTEICLIHNNTGLT